MTSTNPLIRALQLMEVFRSIDPDMPIGAAVSYLMIALGERSDGTGLSVTELAKSGEFPLSNASRWSVARRSCG